MAAEHSVKVSKVPQGTRPDELRAVFEDAGLGGITDVYLPEKFARFEFGFVRFEDFDEANRAAKMQNLEVRGSLLRCELAVKDKRQVGAPPLWKGSPRASQAVGMAPRALPRAAANFGYATTNDIEAGCGMPKGSVPMMKTSGGEVSVWIGSLPWGTTCDELQKAIESRGVGTITDVYIPPGRDFGFLRFAKWEEARHAVHLCFGLKLRGSALEFKLSTAEKRSVGEHENPVLPVYTERTRPHTESSRSPEYGRKACKNPSDARSVSWDRHGPPSTSSSAILVEGATVAEYSIWVGILPPETRVDDLREAFAERGIETMTDVYIPPGRDFGFVRFASHKEADRAMQRCASDLRVMGANVTLKLSTAAKRAVGQQASVMPPLHRGPPAGHSPPYPSHGANKRPGTQGPSMLLCSEVSVKVNNLPANVSREEFLDAFVAQGIDTMTDFYIPPGRKFGFLRFNSSNEGTRVLRRQIWVRGQQLELEPAVGTKRTPDEMFHAEQSRMKRPALATEEDEKPQDDSVPHDPDINPNAPSVKASGVPPEVTAQELHRALLDAGCTGKVTDVYVPKGNRGFGFIRFATHSEAEDALTLSIRVRSSRLSLELAVQERRVQPRHGGW